MKRALLVATVLLAGCTTHGLGITGDSAHGADLGSDEGSDYVGDLGRPSARNKVDILFMVDNSLSMQSKQAELRARFGNFARTLQSAAATHPASYHFGVVTSDLGAGASFGVCRAGGDGAKLQAAPAPGVDGLPAACANFMLGGGVRFIDYDQVNGGDNLGGVDLTTAFSCISAVGDKGCGFEHSLESVYRALHDAIPENAGFLRPDALLAVVYVTDEDDCSAPPTTDLFDGTPNGVATYGALHSFRCTQFGVACGTPATPVQPADSNGPLSWCRPLTPAEGSKLTDVQKYIDQFKRPAAMGGIKADPWDVIVVAMAAPVDPFMTRVTMPCADQVNTASCPILSHSCVSPSDATVFGDPAVRLSTVVQSAVTWDVSSICNGGIGVGLDTLAQRILARLK